MNQTEAQQEVRRVLIVDDHPVVRQGIKLMINAEKDLTICGEAETEQQARRLVRELKPDALVVDLSLSAGDGFNIVRDAHAHFPEIGILVLSMHDEAQMAARALKVGAAGYATKDSEPALLITAIRKVAGGGRYIDPALADRMVFEVGLTDSRPPHAQLSEREFSVFERLVRGEGVNDIALHLAVSNKTISTHKARLMQKLGLHSVADLVRYAMEHKLV
jgi:DNA-binding NarL/FixJ family response regulator